MDIDQALQSISISGGYDPVTQQPLVFVGLGASEDEVGISPQDADHLGHLLIAAAEMALLEADMIRFMAERLDVPLQFRKMILSEFRQWRRKQQEKVDE